jgi:hypothetical protein
MAAAAAIPAPPWLKPDGRGRVVPEGGGFYGGRITRDRVGTQQTQIAP